MRTREDIADRQNRDDRDRRADRAPRRLEQHNDPEDAHADIGCCRKAGAFGQLAIENDEVEGCNDADAGKQPIV
jgi:hypothetical protein